MYTLYYKPMTASLVVHWVLIELKQKLGVEYELSLVDFSTKAQKWAEYLKLNPKGLVPCLVVDDSTPSDPVEPYPITESTAILLFLTERYPEAGLAPLGTGRDRALFLETMVFFANTLQSALRNYIYAAVDGDESSAQGVKALALKRICDGFDLLDRQLESREYLVGDKVSVADYLGVMLASWTRRHPRPAMELENIKKWVARVKCVESYAVLREAEGFPEGA